MFEGSLGDRAAVVIDDKNTFAVADDEVRERLEVAGCDNHKAYKFYADRCIETYLAMRDAMHEMVRYEASGDETVAEGA